MLPFKVIMVNILFELELQSSGENSGGRADVQSYLFPLQSLLLLLLEVFLPFETLLLRLLPSSRLSLFFLKHKHMEIQPQLLCRQMKGGKNTAAKKTWLFFFLS